MVSLVINILQNTSSVFERESSTIQVMHITVSESKILNADNNQEKTPC